MCVCACVCVCMHAYLCMQLTFLYICMAMGVWMRHGVGVGACTYVHMCLHIPTLSPPPVWHNVYVCGVSVFVGVALGTIAWPVANGGPQHASGLGTCARRSVGAYV